MSSETQPFKVSVTVRPAYATGGARALRAIIDATESDTASLHVHRQLATKLIGLFDRVRDTGVPQTASFAYGNAVAAVNLLHAGIHELTTAGATEDVIADARAVAEQFDDCIDTTASSLSDL